MSRSLYVLAMGMTLLTGCVAGPSREATKSLPSAAAFGIMSEAAPVLEAEWWRAFQDPSLDALVSLALHDSSTLVTVQAALDQASAELGGTQSAAGPSVVAAWTEDREHLSSRSYFPPPFGGKTYWNGDLGADLHWNMDLYGRIARRVDAAGREVAARQLQLRSARLAIAAAVVTTYLDWQRAQQVAEATTQVLQQREAALTLAQRRVAHGLGPTSEVTTARLDCDAARADVAHAEAEAPFALHRLGVLTGRGMTNSPLSAARLDPQALVVPAVLPGDLLTRRSDIQAAYQRVAAASDQEDVARLARYPNLDLHAFIGTSAFGLDNLLSAPARVLLAGFSAALPLYDHGSRAAAERGASAATTAAIAHYNQTVLESVREAADALTRVALRERELGYAEAAVLEQQQTLSELQRRRAAGLIDDRPIFAARALLIMATSRAQDLRLAAAAARVSVVVAIGGSADDPGFLTASTSKVSP